MLSRLFSWGVNDETWSWVQLLLHHFTVAFFHAPAAMVDLAVFAALSLRGISKGARGQYVGHFSMVKCWSMSGKVGNRSLTNNLQLITYLILSSPSLPPSPLYFLADSSADS